jgi:Mn2+/Fe2+ NRAMP family transporter
MVASSLRQRIKDRNPLFWTAVINGFLAPPLLVVIMLIVNQKKIMGQRVNGLWANILGWVTTAVILRQR